MKRTALLCITAWMLFLAPAFAQEAKKPEAKVAPERREQIYKLQRDQARKIVEVQQALARYKQLVAENDALVEQLASVVNATVKDAGLDPAAWRLDVDTMTFKPAPPPPSDVKAKQ